MVSEVHPEKKNVWIKLNIHIVSVLFCSIDVLCVFLLFIFLPPTSLQVLATVTLEILTDWLQAGLLKPWAILEC